MRPWPTRQWPKVSACSSQTHHPGRFNRSRQKEPHRHRISRFYTVLNSRFDWAHERRERRVATYATMRISEGVSVFQLAANMGTSVEMIESFYGKKRMRDPKMATEVTKFRGR